MQTLSGQSTFNNCSHLCIWGVRPRVSLYQSNNLLGWGSTQGKARGGWGSGGRTRQVKEKWEGDGKGMERGTHARVLLGLPPSQNSSLESVKKSSGYPICRYKEPSSLCPTEIRRYKRGSYQEAAYAAFIKSLTERNSGCKCEADVRVCGVGWGEVWWRCRLSLAYQECTLTVHPPSPPLIPCTATCGERRERQGRIFTQFLFSRCA